MSRGLFGLLPRPDVAWRIAIDCWFRGDESRVQRLLVGKDELPDFARQWLADVLAGKVKKRRGPKPQDSLSAIAGKQWRDMEVREYFRLQMSVQSFLGGVGTPTERALEAVAARYDMEPDAVSHIVYERKARKSPK